MKKECKEAIILSCEFNGMTYHREICYEDLKQIALLTNDFNKTIRNKLIEMFSRDIEQFEFKK